MSLSLCADVPASPPAYCGRLERPLDPAGAQDGRLSIYFEVYPHSGPGKAVGMLVATEGGPGYPATQSRAEYLALFGPLRRSRDILIMDNRGTGKSGALDCPELQTAERWTTAMVGACGELLGDRAALFGTAPATDDLAAILSALGAGKIDLYGDSYGTYFEQVFALRHPALLRSVVLDGAYPLNGPDYAWYPSYAPGHARQIRCRLPALAGLRRNSRKLDGSHRAAARAASPAADDRPGDRCRRQGTPIQGGPHPSRHGDVRQRARPRHRARARCGRARLSRRRSAAPPSPHGRDRRQRRQRGRAQRRRRYHPMERGPRGGGHVPRSAADFRHAAAARTASGGSGPGARRAPPLPSRHLRAVHHRRISRHAPGLQFHRPVRRVAGGARRGSRQAGRRRRMRRTPMCRRSSFPGNSTT